MLPLHDPTCDVRLLQTQDHLAQAESNRRAASARPAASAVTRAAGVFARIISLMGALVPDSRDGLRSKEQDLAAWGITRQGDGAHDEALALELRAARFRRQVGIATPASVASGQSLRSAVESALNPTSEHLDSLPQPMPAS
jgi:hypothetical protein